MIRAAAQDRRTGRRVIILGLEEGNVDRLRAGKPIHIHADELGFKGEIVVILGKDADALHAAMAPMIGPETDVRDDRERKPS